MMVNGKRAKRYAVQAAPATAGTYYYGAWGRTR